MARSKQRALRFLARIFHPDSRMPGAHPDLTRAREVHAAFERSDDLTGFLIAVPWHPAWGQRVRGERVGMQLERLYEWQEALEGAGERLEHEKAALQQHELYALLLEKRAAEERGEDFFAQLGLRERDEIARLEAALAALQSE